MLYLSDFLKAKVFDLQDNKVGCIIDVMINTNDKERHPIVVGVVVGSQKAKSRELFIRNQDINAFSKKYITLNGSLDDLGKDMPSDSGLTRLKPTVLDKQIIDLEGVRVVRVNDLQFGYIKGLLCLVAIDIGQAGLLRRMGLPFKMGRKELVDWEDIRLMGDKIQLSSTVKDINKLHPADVANLIEKMNLNQGSMLLESMDKSTAARVLEEIEPEIQKILVEKLGPERAAGVMQKMSVDELVDLIQLLPHRESKEFMAELPHDKKKQHVKKILEYDEDTAGGLMTTEYLTAYAKDTVKQVIDTIRRISHMHSSIYFVYVIDEQDQFIGVVSTRALLLAQEDELIMNIMKKGKKIPTAKVEDELIEVAELITKYNLYSVAVLNSNNQLLGIVTVDDIMRHFVPNA